MTIPNSALFCVERRDSCWTEAVRLSREVKLMEKQRARSQIAQARRDLATEFAKWEPPAMPTDQIVELETQHVINHGMTDCGSNLTNKSGVAVPPGLPGGKRHNEAANKRRPLINADHPGRIGVLHEAFGLAPKPRGLGAIILQDPKKLEWDFVLSRAKAKVQEDQQRKAAQRSASAPGL
jgi:hypothetical protein